MAASPCHLRLFMEFNLTFAYSSNYLQRGTSHTRKMQQEGHSGVTVAPGHSRGKKRRLRLYDDVLPIQPKGVSFQQLLFRQKWTYSNIIQSTLRRRHVHRPILFRQEIIIISP
eukprot:2345620-Ditylum_brightwellii.AAC.1